MSTYREAYKGAVKGTPGSSPFAADPFRKRVNEMIATDPWQTFWTKRDSQVRRSLRGAARRAGR